MKYINPLQRLEKEIEVGFHRPPLQPTLNETLLGIFAGLSLFSVLSCRKKPLPIPSRLLGAVVIPLTLFGLYKAGQIEVWRKSGKEALLKRKNLTLGDLEEQKLTPEERAFLIREDFSGEMLYANFLERHGIERVEALFADGGNVEYRDQLKAKFLDAVAGADLESELEAIPSLPVLQVTTEEYIGHIKADLKRLTEEWTGRGWDPNPHLVEALFSKEVMPSEFDSSEIIYCFLDKEGKQIRSARLCLEYVFNGDTEIHRRFYEQGLTFIGQFPSLLPLLAKHPLCDLSTLEPSVLSRLLECPGREREKWSEKAIVQAIKDYRLDPNEQFLLEKALKSKDGSLSRALLRSGATVSKEYLQEIISHDDSESLEVLMVSPLFDVNQRINDQALIIEAIINEGKKCASVLWNHPKLDKSVQLYRRSLQQLAKEYGVNLEVDPV